MAKYAPLTSFLRRQKQAEVDLTFRDIERIVGGILPKAAAVDGWWRADPSGPLMPQHIAFANAGFVAEPRTRAETVHFVRRDAIRASANAGQVDEWGGPL
jgi:hypothetical protein